jgi:prepilin-type N-terminal cleavage/methylation domain-containing protein
MNKAIVLGGTIMFKKLNKKGFTLAELLIVVAIIGVLVAISIPIFTSQLEKSRDAVTLANLRSAYAEAQTTYLTANGKDATETDGNQTVTYTAAENTVSVSNVVSKGTAAGLSGTDQLPFTVNDTITEKDGMGGTAKSTWTVTFKYTTDDSGNVTKIEASAN